MALAVLDFPEKHVTVHHQEQTEREQTYQRQHECARGLSERSESQETVAGGGGHAGLMAGCRAAGGLPRDSAMMQQAIILRRNGTEAKWTRWSEQDMFRSVLKRGVGQR